MLLAVLFACVATPPPNVTPVAPGSGGAYGPAPQRIVITPSQSPFAGIQPVTTPSGLTYWVLRPGTGPVPQAGQRVRVHYTGWLADGTKFDSSFDRGQPLEFVIGGRQVIKGWDEAVSTMQVGEARRLQIPPALGYGSAGAGGMIPGGATLIFEVELVGIE